MVDNMPLCHAYCKAHKITPPQSRRRSARPEGIIAKLAASRQYIDEIVAAEGEGNLQLITFAEKPTVVREGDGPLSAAIARHPGAGAGTDIQAAMQLAYGLYPDGYLPRMVIKHTSRATDLR